MCHEIMKSSVKNKPISKAMGQLALNWQRKIKTQIRSQSQIILLKYPSRRDESS